MADHARVEGLDQPRLQELLAYLLLHRGRPVARQHLAFLFWPDSTEDQARTNLRTLWHRLRRALPDADRFLVADEAAMQWRGDAPCWLDVAEFEAHLRLAQSAADTLDQLRHLEQAVAVYAGDLLPGCYTDWLLAERERLAKAYGNALEQLAALQESRRAYSLAISHVQALLRHDPLYWQALWPLIGVSLTQDRLADAIPLVQKLCDPGQQVLPAALDDPLIAALTAWDTGQPDTAHDLLQHAVGLARQMNLS